MSDGDERDVVSHLAEPGHEPDSGSVEEGFGGAKEPASDNEGGAEDRQVIIDASQDQPVESVGQEDIGSLSISSEYFWRGELPMPADFNAYSPTAQEVILENARRRLAMQEEIMRESFKLDELESSRIDASEADISKQSMEGMRLSAALDCALIVATCVCAALNQPVIAGLLVGMGFVTIVPPLLKTRGSKSSKSSPKQEPDKAPDRK